MGEASTAVRRRVGNIAFTVETLDDAIDDVLALATDVESKQAPGARGRAVHFANAYNVALARNDADYARVLQAGDRVFSDGVPITWVGARAYPDLAAHWQRVYGPDVMQGVFARSGAEGPRHYLLGGSPETLDALVGRLRQEYPSALVVGAESPPFEAPTPADLRQRDERIAASGATIVWVGLGTPKQDVEVRRLADELPVVAMAVGAAFDFLARTKPQAPEWMQRNGFEWAFRLASEPRRLGSRYLWGNTVFLEEALRTMTSIRRER
jgi:N-acetylglucosaminyldiphosphoundecaprenol N-acetyl-beta-D-mannosaminyltransferase